MKIMKRIIALLLGIITIFSVSCGKPTENTDNPENSEVVIGNREKYNGTHVFTAMETGDYILKNGRSDYSVIIPENAKAVERTAAKEFVELFSEATDVVLNVVADTGLSHSSTAKYISIGETSLAKENTDIAEKKKILGRDGCRIVTKDKSIYIYGGSETGTLYSVYDYMSIMFDFDYYYLDCMDIKTNVKDVKLLNFDVTDIPDFDHRAGSNNLFLNDSTVYTENTYANRMRVNGQRGSNIMPIHKDFNTYAGARASTNSLTYLPIATYKGDHPAWFSDNGSELCFTAHGNEDEYKLMVEECAKKVENSLKLYTPEEYPYYNAVSLTQQDNYEYCTCSKCHELTQKYGGIVGVYIVFMNDLAETVNAWMDLPENSQFKREDFTYYFFAYQYTLSAPAKYNAETEKYEPNHPDIAIHKNVGVYLALSDFNNQIEFWHEDNKRSRDNIEMWTDLSNNVLFWLYGTNFRNYMWMYDSFNSFLDGSFAWFANRSNKQMFIQFQEQTKGTLTAWNNLKNYLYCKMTWDTSLDAGELLQKYFDAMYGPASSEMMSMFYEMRTYYNKVILEEYKMKAMFATLEKSMYWPILMLDNWMAKLDAIKEKANVLKDVAPEKYEKICQHIESECISVMYITLSCHSSVIKESTKKEYIDRLYYDIEWMGLEGMALDQHGGTVKEWLNGLQ